MSPTDQPSSVSRLPRRAALVAAGAAAFLSACGGGSRDDPQNVVEVLRKDPSTSILAQAIDAAGLLPALIGAGPFTVFAPTDAAFAALLSELNLTQGQLLADRALLTSVLQYHVLGSRVARASVPVGRPISPLSGGIFKVDAAGNGLVVTDGRNRTANITAIDIAAPNGLIHKIDKVLLPANRNLVQTAQANPAFSILVEAVVAADLAGTLSSTGPFTVFAPTDAAFAALLTELGLTKAQLLANKALLTRVLTYHVLPARVLKAEVPVGSPIATVQGENFSIDAQLAITDRNGRSARITATDVLASNGVIHVIDKVILPKIPNLVELAVSQPQFSILVEAVQAAGLVGALSGTTPLTVFAPTNDAFAALLGELGLSKAELLANVPLLTTVLTYHVVPGRVVRAGVPIGQPITSLQGGTFTVGADLRITDARARTAGITATDALAINGVVHTLDRVILP
ncbi:fasciclin domain-containing protein [Inhella sp.]|uniref:fasciclin domain-containing protein n=1 Tax=Inhella sp. TaxID=1921806 RepID=UPI0035B2BFCB